MKQLNPNIYKIHKVMDFAGVIFLVFMLLFIWQLYRGPISVPFLKPYIIKALNRDDSQYQVKLDDVNIELVRSIRPLKIIATNVDYSKNNGEVKISAPKTSLSFSIKALLKGIIAPSSVKVIKPTIYIFTDYGTDEKSKNQVNSKKIEYYFDYFDRFIERFNSADKAYPESYINDITIENAEVEFHEVDLGRKWAFSDLNYKFERNFVNIKSDINALIHNQDRVSSLGVEAEYRPNAEKLALRFYFSDIMPDDLLKTVLGAKQPATMYQIKVPVSGKVETLVDFAEVMKHRKNIINSLDKAVEQINFNIEGASGQIVFPDHQGQDYKLSGFALDGKVNGALDKIKIENASFDLGTQKAAFSLYVSGVKDYFLNKSLEQLKVKLHTSVDLLKFDELYDYWPRYLGTVAWDWCKNSLFGGEIKKAAFDFEFGYDAKQQKFAFQNLKGVGQIVDSNLNYLHGMPDITNMYGQATFTNDSIRIDVDKAISANVMVNGGYVLLHDLNRENNFAKINLEAESSITDALRLIDNPPLNYAGELGLKPETIQGNAHTNLKLDFELKSDLAPHEVKVEVASDLQNVIIPKALNDKDVSSPQLNLQVNNQGMNINGDIVYDGVPAKLSWQENFAEKKYRSRYNLSFKFNEEFKQKFGIDFSAIEKPFIDGYVLVDAEITSFDNQKMQVDLKGNVQHASVDYSFLGLRKPLHEYGQISARLDFKDMKLVDIPYIGINKRDFTLKGKIGLNADGQVSLIDIYHIKAPKTDAKAKIDIAYNPNKKVKIHVSGNTYDLSEFFNKKDSAPKSAKAKYKSASQAEDDLENVTDTDIFIAVNSLWTNEFVSVKNFAGSAQLRNGIGIREMHLIGNFGKATDKFLKLDYTPRNKEDYLLAIDSNDAGGTLKFLRIYDHMRGGILSINGKRNKDKKLIGHAKIRDFSIHNTPVLAKLLTVASLSGMLNLLTGEGMAFSHFDAPFSYQHNVLTLEDSKAFGNVMGITAKGNYDISAEQFDINGTIAPVYGLNTFIGKIPVVGNLLSSKDGTVFAANYSISGYLDDPDININPLSALSPGSLKDLWNSLFGDKEN